MIRPPARIHIDTSPTEVIGFIGDPANGPQRISALEVVELITPRPIGVGSRFREVQSVGGQGTELPCDCWATTTGRLADREAGWPARRQREAEAELAAIKQAVEDGGRKRDVAETGHLIQSQAPYRLATRQWSARFHVHGPSCRLQIGRLAPSESGVSGEHPEKSHAH
jgi:hypothetical protein